MTSVSRGFTLVETIFSTLFISLTVLAIINLFPGAYLAIKRSETSLQSDFVANSVLEELRMMSFEDLPVGELNRTGPPFEAQTIDGVGYTPRVWVYDVPDTDPLIVKGVKVEVSYRVRASNYVAVHETYIHSMVR